MQGMFEGLSSRRSRGMVPFSNSCNPVTATSLHQRQQTGSTEGSTNSQKVCVVVCSIGNCYDDIIQQLAHRALAAAQQLPQHKQHIVGIAGSPGSGKSTLAQSVAKQINRLCQQQGLSRGAAVAPMDGFHLYKAQLDAMPNPQVSLPWPSKGAVLHVRHWA
jgi:pantothenate kinase